MNCPFYRVEKILVERRKRQRNGQTARRIETPAPWCAHLYSPVSKYIAISVVGGWKKLRCEGDLAKCQVVPSRRPTT